MIEAITTFIVSAVLFATGMNGPSDKSPNEGQQTVEEEGQHFCCQDTDPKTQSGQSCSAVGKESINTCDDVLYCPKGWTKKDGNVTCNQ